ncbi:MAG: TrmH family RNA methyltransferase [Candidatus Dormibacteraceae bacterium]
MPHSPKDTYITIYGRKPVLEALRDPSRHVAKVIVATNAEGSIVGEIEAVARAAGVRVSHAAPQRVKSIAGNGRHDQGVVADVEAPALGTLDDLLAERSLRGDLLLLDGVHNPQNVGLILRAAAAMGLAGTVLPRVGAPDLGPLVIKASAGVAFQARVLRCRTAEEAAARLRQAGVPLYGLGAARGESLPSAALRRPAAFVVGDETVGVSPAVADRLDGWLSIPMAPGVESLNVATAVAILGYELRRRTTIGQVSTDGPGEA